MSSSGGAIELVLSGLGWRAEPSGAGELEGIRALLGRWKTAAREPGSEILKENRIRTVALIPAAQGRTPGWVVKEYRHGGWKDRVKHLFMSSRAVTEWRALRRLRALGFDAPRPVAVGERREMGIPVEGGLVMEEIPGAVSLLEALRPPGGRAGAAAGSESLDLLERTGALVRALHDRGADPVDLHGGNFLIPQAGPRCGAIHVIDLHSARFHRMGPGARARRLGKLLHSLSGTVAPEGLRVLLAGYLGISRAEALSGGRSGRARDLDRWERGAIRQAARIERVRLRSRSRRCLLESTSFAVERSGGVRLLRRREVPPETLEALFAGAGRKIKAEGPVLVEEMEAGGRRFLVKRRRLGLGEGLRALLSPHRLLRAWKAGFALEVRGVPSPAVLALREERRLGILRSAVLVTAFVDGGVDLERHLRATCLGRPPARGGAARSKFALARRTGALLRRAHEAGIHLPDCAPKNILVRTGALALDAAGKLPPGEPVVLLADLDGVRPGRGPTLRRRLRALVQAGNLPEGHVGRTDLLRALRSYAGGELSLLEPSLLGRLRKGLLREAERSLDRWLRSAPR